MKIRFSYECDSGHRWFKERDEEALEPLEDTYCPDGHEAVICRKERPANIVSVCIRPLERRSANRPSDGFDVGVFQVCLIDVNDFLFWISEAMNAETAIKRANLLIGKSPEESLRLIDRLKMGGQHISKP